jgi:hypothetical protein
MKESAMQKPWDKERDDFAFELEEAFLKALAKQQKDSNPNNQTVIESLAVATAHAVQVYDQSFNYKADFKKLFTRQFNEAYNYYVENPTKKNVAIELAQI